MEEFFKDLKSCCQEIYHTIHYEMKESFYGYEGHGAGGDLSSKIDLFAEKIFIERLCKYGRIHSEESGVVGAGERTIILDPIDGSDNLLSSFPYYGASIALKDSQTLFSCIVNFANGDFFVKWDTLYKKGSLLHDRLEDVKLNPYSKIGIFEKAYANPIIVKKLQEHRLKFRSPGAVALSLAYARYVRYVLFIGKLRPYDIEAGLHQCKGLYLYLDESTILVSKERQIFDMIRDILTKEKDGSKRSI